MWKESFWSLKSLKYTLARTPVEISSNKCHFKNMKAKEVSRMCLKILISILEKNGKNSLDFDIQQKRLVD